MRTRSLVFVAAATIALAAPVSGVDARHRPRVEVPSQIVIGDVTPTGFVYGTVSAGRSVCEQERHVTITRNDVQLPTTQTDSSGDWSTISSAPRNGDRFTAEIERERIRSGNRIFVC